MPQHLRTPGQYSILLAVFSNEETDGLVTLVQILWEINEKIDEVYAIARGDKSIPEHLSNLGQSRELKKTLRKRDFEAFDRFSAYSEVFRARLGIPGENALEVFNQAIGVKEVTDINQFIRRHMLEPSDVLEFIHSRLRPHFNELDACWRAIERAEKQLEILAPIVECHRRIEEAKGRRQEFERLLEVAPIYYADLHHQLREKEAEALANKWTELKGRYDDLDVVRLRDEAERDAKLQEIAADTTQQSILRIGTQIESANERLRSRQQRWQELSSRLGILNRLQVIESEEQFISVREAVVQEEGKLQSDRIAADEQRVKFRMEQEEVLKQRGEVAGELETLRKHRVLIPREFVDIREAVSAATGVTVKDLPFAGELIEVKSEFREWTGAIERLLHPFSVSLVVPQKHFLPVAQFINKRHLGIRFTFHRVPESYPSLRSDVVGDGHRVFGRLNFREQNPLIKWVKGEVARRFNHVCCTDVKRLSEVDYGLTKEGLIRDGQTRHIKDDRSAVNDVTRYVLGWSIEDKIKALMRAFEQTEARATTAGLKASEIAVQLRKLEEQLVAVKDVLSIRSFTEIDFRSVQVELGRLNHEKSQLEESSDKLKALKAQLDETQNRLVDIKNHIEDIKRKTWDCERTIGENKKVREKLTVLLQQHPGFTRETVTQQFDELQLKDRVEIESISVVEKQVTDRLNGQLNYQTRLVNEAREAMLPAMTNFLRDYPEHTANLQANADFAQEFATLLAQIKNEELPQHKQRFEEFLGTNLIGDMAMFHTNLLEHEKGIRNRVDSVNGALRKIPFSDTSHVQIVAQFTRADDIRQFRAQLKDCLAGGLHPSAEDRLRIFARIRELMSRFEKDEHWTRRVTDARQWLEFGVREITDADGREVNYFSASSGKSGGQKTKLAFTILASAITAQYGLVSEWTGTDTFRLVVIDEVFARTDEANSQRALELFKNLDLQLIVVNPFDAKGRIVEDYVDSFHLAANTDGSNSKLRRASRIEYEAARNELGNTSPSLNHKISVTPTNASSG